MTATTRPPPAELRVLRKFGINENYQMAMYLLDQYRGTCLSCRYKITPSLAPAAARPQLEQAFRAAAVDIIMRHPMLQVGMKNCNSKTPSWVQLPHLDLAQHIKWQYLDEGEDLAQTVQQLFCAQLDEQFPDPAVDSRPNWTMMVVRQGSDAPEMEVLLTWNHPQFDGAGARVIHEDLVRALNDTASRSNPGSADTKPGLDGNILTLPTLPPVLPVPIEKLAKLPVDLKHLTRTLWGELRPPILNRDPTVARWCPVRVNTPAVPYRTQFRAFAIDAEGVGAILAQCRAHQTTVTGLVNGLALLSFARQLDAAVAPAFQSSTVMDHRRNLPPAETGAPWEAADRAVANYVTQLPHRYNVSLVAKIRSKFQQQQQSGLEAKDNKAGNGLHGGNKHPLLLAPDLLEEMWAVATRSRSEITRQLALGLRNDILGIFKYVGDWQGTMREMARRPRLFTWLVTNIGVLNGRQVAAGSGRGGDGGVEGQDAPSWSITRAQFGLSAETPAAAIEFSPVSVVGGGMVVGANWHDCAVDVGLGERVVGDLQRWMEQLAGQR
ncbi:hypothetical protein Micbo1qcDRAFT_219216 [Microdochium bolleyi]|uniref:Alcohol acetyltransferase n=1 Tax=Microdochium bolleyi TaxID=196109 RepID=A0A136INW7_9PEZI|nr:hypothetical protein Micbo1qcDRAFT_219216 [Microdochium bolleyi]